MTEVSNMNFLLYLHRYLRRFFSRRLTPWASPCSRSRGSPAVWLVDWAIFPYRTKSVKEMISRCVLLCSGGTHPMQKMIRLMSHPDPGGLGWYEKEALVLQVVHSSSSAYPEYSLG